MSPVKLLLIAALAKQSTQPDPQLLQQVYQQGNTSIQLGGAPGRITLVIKNYLKQGDSMTLVFDESSRTIQPLQIASCLTDPKDAVTIAVQFAKLPAGVKHVATAQINRVSSLNWRKPATFRSDGRAGLESVIPA